MCIFFVFQSKFCNYYISLYYLIYQWLMFMPSASPWFNCNKLHYIRTHPIQVFFSSLTWTKFLLQINDISNVRIFQLNKSIRRVWRYQRVIRICISKNRQHNGQKKKYKQRSTKHTHKTKDRVTQTPLKTGGELRCSVRVSSFSHVYLIYVLFG